MYRFDLLAARLQQFRDDVHAALEAGDLDRAEQRLAGARGVHVPTGTMAGTVDPTVPERLIRFRDNMVAAGLAAIARKSDPCLSPIPGPSISHMLLTFGRITRGEAGCGWTGDRVANGEAYLRRIRQERGRAFAYELARSWEASANQFERMRREHPAHAKGVLGSGLPVSSVRIAVRVLRGQW